MSFFHFACLNLAAAKLPHGQRRMPPGMVDPPNCTARSVEVRPLPRWRFALRPRFSISVSDEWGGQVRQGLTVYVREQVFKVLCSDLAEGADRGAYLSCRFERAVREPTDELQGVSVQSEAYWLRLQAEYRLNVHRKRDCDALSKVVAFARHKVFLLNSANAPSSSGVLRLVYLLGGVPCSESGFGNGQEILLKRP